MKKALLRRGTAMLAAACMITPMLAVSVGAEEAGSVLLPSGHAVEWVENQIKLYTDDSTELLAMMPYASFSAVIFKGDEILYSGCYGEADRENHIPTDENTVYEWGSISKTMVWVSAMQLWEQGLLDLEADIRTYLPENFFQHLKYDDPITMLDLMNHTGGWAEPTFGFSITDADKILPLGEALQMCEPAQVARPGEMTGYSNWGAALAGYVVECISGMDYCDYVHENILKPLGMEHTAVNADHSDNAWVQQQREQIKCYQVTAFSVVRSLGSCMTYFMLYPAGSATGTIGDLTRYAQAFADDSAPLFRHPETQAMLLSGSDFFGDSDIPSSCHGFAPMEYAVRTVGHDGGTFGFRSMMLVEPESKIGVITLVSDPNGGVVCPIIPEMVFGTLSPTTYADGENTVSASFEGYYLPARSCLTGMLKFQSYLDALHMERSDPPEQIGTDIYQISEAGTAQLFGVKHYSGGGIGLNLGSADYIEARTYLPMLLLFASYVLAAVISACLLRIKHKLRKAGRLQRSVSGSIRTAAQTAKVGSVLMLLLAAAIYTKFYGLPQASGIIIGVLQMVCTALCIAAAAVSVRELLSQKTLRHRLRCLCNIAGNAVTVCAVILFEMYRFWAC